MNVLNARVYTCEEQIPVVRISSGRRSGDPLAPYISTREIGFPHPGGPLHGHAAVVLPDAITDHVNAVALQFERPDDVDALMSLLTEVRRRLAQTYPTDDELGDGEGS